MKEKTQATLQYSVYPLTIAEIRNGKQPETRLVVIRHELYNLTTFIQKSKISNDPSNWDVNWFGSYE